MSAVATQVLLVFALISSSACQLPHASKGTVFQPLTRSSLVPSALEHFPAWKSLSTANSTEEHMLCRCATDAAALASAGPVMFNLVEASLALTAQFQINCLHMISPQPWAAKFPNERTAELFVAAQVEKIEAFLEDLMERVEYEMTVSAPPTATDQQLTRLMWMTVKDVCKNDILRRPLLP